MTKLLIRLLPVLVLVPIGAGALSAQSPTTLPRTAELPASTRAMALGNAYMMNAGRSNALFYHPALLTRAAGAAFELQRWGPEASRATASVAGRQLGGGVALGLQVLQYSAPTAGRLAAPGGQDHLFAAGPIAVSERVATVGYARALFGIDLGVAAKLVEERVGTFRDATFLFDVGASTEVGPFTAAITYQNFGEGLQVGAADFERPDLLRLGIGAYGRQLGIFDLGLTAALEYAGDEFVPAGGLEIGYWPIVGRTFVARIGARRVPAGEASPLTFGFAFWADDLRLEWAFQPVDVSGSAGTHSFGVGWR